MFHSEELSPKQDPGASWGWILWGHQVVEETSGLAFSSQIKEWEFQNAGSG